MAEKKTTPVGLDWKAVLSEDSDGFRVLLQRVVQEVMEAEMTEALGAENVLGIGMPSPYSSTGSIDDSRELAANLGIRFEVIPISGLFAEFTHALEPLFAGTSPDTTEENIQSRIRGCLLMALSN